MTPKIILKNLKYAAFASEETSCFSATVYCDGKRLCTARNDGRGGCDSYDALSPPDGFTTGEEAGAARRWLEAEITRIGGLANPMAVDKWDETGTDVDEETVMYGDRESLRRTVKTITDVDGKVHSREALSTEDWMMRTNGVTKSQVFECLVGDALTVALYTKDMKSAMSKKWLYTVPGEEGIYQIKRSKGEPPELAESELRKAYPGATLLNTLAHEEALVIWKAN